MQQESNDGYQRYLDDKQAIVRCIREYINDDFPMARRKRAIDSAVKLITKRVEAKARQFYISDPEDIQDVVTETWITLFSEKSHTGEFVLWELLRADSNIDDFFRIFETRISQRSTDAIRRKSALKRTKVINQSAEELEAVENNVESFMLLSSDAKELTEVEASVETHRHILKIISREFTEEEAAVVDMRADGATWVKVAETLGMSVSTAKRLFKRARNKVHL